MIDIRDIQNNNWGDTRISIIGAGKSGLAAANLGKYLGSEIFISDNDDSSDIRKNVVSFCNEIGGHSERILDAHLIVISPGVSDRIPIIQKCQSQSIPIISEIEFASWFTTSPILALTGSNGKTTTVQLLHEMCVSDGKTSLLGGNVGIPFSENVLWELTSEISSPVHVLELSSFQLEHVRLFSPAISGILNISPDHMDRYEDFDAYVSKKLKLAEQTQKKGWVIYNADDPVLFKSLTNIPRTAIFSITQNPDCYFKLNASKVYSGQVDNPKILFKLEDSNLKGPHNLRNVLAAATMAHKFDISHSAIQHTIMNFTPIPHRLEWIGNINNVDYFNDSKATNIAATRAAIESFDENLILILGGQDKGSTDFLQLSLIMKNRVKSIVAYGEAGIEIKNQLKTEFQINCYEKFDDAVIQAHEQAESRDTILLSPSCTSFDQFSNYEERGERFIKLFTTLEMGI